MSDELTSLGWLSAITTVRNRQLHSHINNTASCSKHGQKKDKEKIALSPTAVALKSMKEHRRRHRPPCSYSCLIAMALMASPTGCLPVHHIYRFIEQQYPFYRTAPEGWKNSVRHNLSMNQNFIKLLKPNSSVGVGCYHQMHAKKGYYWAINPVKMPSLEIEVEKSLSLMKRDLIEDVNSSSSNKQNFYANESDKIFQGTATSQLYCPTPVVDVIQQIDNKPNKVHSDEDNLKTQNGASTGQVVIRNDINTLVLVNLLSTCAGAGNTKILTSDKQTANDTSSSTLYTTSNEVLQHNEEPPCKWIGEECVVIDNNEDTFINNTEITTPNKKRKLVHDHIYYHDTATKAPLLYTTPQCTASSEGISSVSCSSLNNYKLFQEELLLTNSSIEVGESITEQLMLSSSPSNGEMPHHGVAEQCTIFDGELPFAQFELEN